MILHDTIDFTGHFSLKIFKKDGTIETYEEKNLIMTLARENMAALVGGWTTGGVAINKFVIGTKGHVGSNILDFVKVGEGGFTTERTNLFSEALDQFRYVIGFNAVSTNNNLSISTNGQVNGAGTNTPCTVLRNVTSRTTTYTITIPEGSGNSTDAIAYTEAGLYAGSKLFSMKTFPARVKEDSVKFEIKWSIIF